MSAAALHGTKQARGQHGSSLIELLVVLVIVGVVLGSITLAVGGSGGRALEDAARRAQVLISLACERAELGGHDLGFSLVGDGLRFGYFGAQGWQPFAPGFGDELRERPLGAGLLLELRRDGELLAAADSAEPQLACLASGELTPFELRLARADVDGQWRVRGHLDGRIDVETDDAR